MLIDVVGLGFGGGYLLRGWFLKFAFLARLRLGSMGIVGNQDFAEADALRLGDVRLVLVVKFLGLVAGDLDMATYFRADYLLRENAVLGVLLELFPAYALRFGELLEVFHGAGLHLLAEVIEALDEISVSGNSKVGSLLDEQLLVNEITQGVCLTKFHLLLREIQFL